ncbi:DUF6082 family protein [Streptomyces albidoflavus]|uniref:Secreted protein n=1 Tax=Streptomyces wadayamensis TaxID=141454 RepID=A0ABR4S707_9ACTN|nr:MULTISPECIES: DUF6082 family protein [Streptomyces]KDR60980.1 hypothetical protein DC60_02755 [Streptomyces wadayamensis]QXQ25877.1 hypothetical protein STALF2_14715 [Streptomyces albidoflavus]QXQ31806.1 hypothetical protein STALF4_14765 [Streptomyces albidoflavus]
MSRNTPAAFALAAGLGAAHLVLKYRQHKDTVHLACTQLHARTLADTAADPRLLTAVWEDTPEDEAVQHVLANRWMTAWSLMLRVGYTPESSLKASLHEFMQTKYGRAFWERAGNYRAMNARDRHDRKFVKLAAEAFHGADAFAD